MVTKILRLIITLFLSGCCCFSQNQKQTFKIQAENYLKAPNNNDALTFLNALFTFDSQGNLFIADLGKIRILKFSPEGNYLQTIGRKGEGPGEFDEYYNMDVSSDGFIYVTPNLAQNKIVVFDQKGKYFKEIKNNKSFKIIKFIILKNNIIAAHLYDQTIIKDKGIQTKQYHAIINLNNLSQKQAGDIIITGPMDLPFTNIVKDSKSRFYYGLRSQDKYEIFLYNENADLIKKIYRNIIPIKMQGEHLKEFNKNAEMRKMILKRKAGIESKKYDEPYYNIIQSLATDSYDNLWVFTSEGNNDNLFSVDLYDIYTNYKKTFYLDNPDLVKGIPQIKIYKDYLYAYIISKDGYEHIYRYKIPKEVWQ
jgi:hypothetical protein